MVQGEKADYSKTTIYKIVCKDINVKESYGGHTTSLVKRRYCHKSSCNNINSKKYNIYLYQFIKENGGWENWDMIWCYDFPCENKHQAEFEERKFIEKEKCELNSYRPITTKEERRHCSNIHSKNYNKNNKEKIAEYYKEYRKNNKDIRKKYYENNKDKINKQKITCECGCEINKSNLSAHKKSKKHIKLMTTI